MNTKQKQIKAAAAPEAPHLAGTPVLFNGGYRGTIVRHYSGGMYEIRSERGIVCTDDFVVPAAAKPAHTPGPWWIEQRPQSEKYPDLHDNLIMAKYCGQDCVVASIDNSDEDARLIAAAPTMLQALKQYVEEADCERVYPRANCPILEKARAAIAAAEGSAQ